MITNKCALNESKTFDNGNESESCVVSIKSTYKGYVLSIDCEPTRRNSSIEICAAPNDKDLSNMGSYIYNVVKMFYANLDETKVVALASEIIDWCNKVIGTYTEDLLTNNIIKADHCYIKCVLMGQQKHNSQFSGWIRMVMCKNQAELYQINSRQLVKWLTENPETPIYQTLTAQEAERDLIAGTASAKEQIEAKEATALMTTAQRFKTKIERYSGEKLLFKITGIKYPSNAELARLKNW